MGLSVPLSYLMDAIDSESEFEDYGYFLDPATGAVHLLWDMRADDSDDPALFEELSARIDDFVKLPDRSTTDLYERARAFTEQAAIDERGRKKLEKACKKAARKNNISLFLAEANALGLHDQQQTYWDACDESTIRQWCTKNGIEIREE